ncbi:MAG: TlpA family protein disulfide reductase [Acidobacteria bacterium]|nr:TlpA family protein disulfide reductase [Acidobacteriota bacterium]
MTRRPILLLVTLVVIVAFAYGVRYTREVSQSLAEPRMDPVTSDVSSIQFVKNPPAVPEFEARDLDGRPIAPAALKGKALIINFWATWCGPCRIEIPDLIALQQKYGARLQVIGISTDDPDAVETVRRFAREQRINYPIVMGAGDLEQTFGGIYGIPTSFIVDPRGRMVQRHVGLRSRALFEQEIRAVLNMKVAVPVEVVQDKGKVFLENAAYATEIPGLDLSRFAAKARQRMLERLNSDKCTCGCGLTLAQCRINDPDCTVSLPAAQKLVATLTH